MRRMEEDAGGVGDEEQTEHEPEKGVFEANGKTQAKGRGWRGHGSGLWMAVTDWRVWWLSLALTSQVVALSFNAYFPTLSQTMGYSTTVSLLLCAPPFLFAAIVAFVLSRHSDKTGERFYHIISSLGTGVLGFVIAVSTMNTAARYISL